jgi:carbonic anhydrase/acetyltransferase-like protein (isoleucine patch superfamily)
VLTAEGGPIVIGDDCVVMDTVVVRGIRNNPLTVGNNVLVGPRAYLTGCNIGDNVFLGTGATMFNGARIGDGSEIRINSVVHLRTVLPPNSIVPIGCIAVGDPAEILSPDQHDRIWSIQKQLDFPQYVFEVQRPPEGESIMPKVMPRYARMLNRHCKDKVL